MLPAAGVMCKQHREACTICTFALTSLLQYLGDGVGAQAVLVGDVEDGCRGGFIQSQQVRLRHVIHVAGADLQRAQPNNVLGLRM
jgi:hypothetical protein